MESSVKRLFCICLDYISNHIDDLESLHEFPDQIGREIFSSAVKKQKFINLKGNIDSLKNLQLFFTAYSDCGILDSLNANQSQLFVNNTIDDQWWLYQSLRHLDLNSCGLGDAHDILPQLVTMERLEILILSNNALSDEGIRRLTLRSRMSKFSSPTLRCLDISDNAEITSRSLHFLTKFGQLQVLKISAKASGKTEWISHCVSCDLNGCVQLSTRGWAADILEAWLNEYQERQPSSKGLSFYPKKKINVEEIQGNSFKNIPKVSLMPPFYKCSCIKDQAKPSLKRPRDSLNCLKENQTSDLLFNGDSKRLKMKKTSINNSHTFSKFEQNDEYFGRADKGRNYQHTGDALNFQNSTANCDYEREASNNKSTKQKLQTQTVNCSDLLTSENDIMSFLSQYS